MVRSRASGVSNHEAKCFKILAFILRDARKGALLRMRSSVCAATQEKRSRITHGDYLITV
jgi:hypothetical protein